MNMVESGPDESVGKVYQIPSEKLTSIPQRLPFP